MDFHDHRSGRHHRGGRPLRRVGRDQDPELRGRGAQGKLIPPPWHPTRSRKPLGQGDGDDQQPGAPTPPSLPADQRGERLFVAKGCVACHLHRDVPGSGEHAVGPELTGRRLASAYLRQFLADPSIGPARQSGSEGMPNLGLKPDEIAALTAFLGAERQALR
ncbi:MAG: c-type cytochrome [Gemmatimonadales bacterium]